MLGKFWGELPTNNIFEDVAYTEIYGSAWLSQINVTQLFSQIALFIIFAVKMVDSTAEISFFI